MIRNKLSAKLGELRMSQAELARVTGIRANTINELYNNWAERISFNHWNRICAAIGCKVEDLFEYEPDISRTSKADVNSAAPGNSTRRTR